MSISYTSKALSNQKVKRSTVLRKVCIALLIISSVVIANVIFSNKNSTLAKAAGPEISSLKHNSVNNFTRQESANIEQAISLNTVHNLGISGGNNTGNNNTGNYHKLPLLEPSAASLDSSGHVSLSSLPKFNTEINGQAAGLNKKGELVYYTIDSQLQEYVNSLITSSDAPHVAIVAMDPKTGNVLAIAEKSPTISDLSLYSGLPAASLFKVITSAAALELNKLSPYSPIYFRGGLYSINKGNYLPNPRKDKRWMSFEEALAKSCNPVFGRIAMQHLSPNILRQYVDRFGFNNSIGAELPLEESKALIPADEFNLSRTGAGFGDVYISPVHAASIMSAIANDGLMPRPRIVQKILKNDGAIVYQANQQQITRIINKETAEKLLDMMKATTRIGTSRKEFMKKGKPVLPVSVAAKTGTLSGSNPKGTNYWFIAAAPANNPKIAISVIVVSSGFTRSKASAIGRKVIEEYLGL
jgi:penicillin-binding protein A